MAASNVSGAPPHVSPFDQHRKSDMATTSLPPPLTAKDPAGFAYKTVRERLAVILTRTMDTASNDVATMGSEACDDMKLVAARLTKLRDEIAANKPLVALEDDFEDATVWNAVLDKYTANGKGNPPRWYDAPWLYFETYFYRRIFGAFYVSAKLKEYDYFAKFKHEALDGSINAVRILIDSAAASEHRDVAPAALRQATRRLVEISLWGNRCDLSLSCGADASSQADALQKTDALRPFIISNDTDKLLEHLWKLRERNLGGNKPTQLHCVMDNSGYELSSDLVLFDFLHVAGYVTGVTLHAKAIPYYVSDAMRRDVSWTLRKMQESQHESMRALAGRCQRRFADGAWSVQDDIFWTQPFDYAQMATRRPELYKTLQSADLVFFKGDVNYRKLVGDLEWDPSVPFKQALRGFEPTFLCTLRTVKSNTVAGVDRSVVREVAQRSPDWMITGEYAVIQCAGTA